MGDSSEAPSRKELPCEELCKQLDKLLKDSADNQRIFDWIEVRRALNLGLGGWGGLLESSVPFDMGARWMLRGRGGGDATEAGCGKKELSAMMVVSQKHVSREQVSPARFLLPWKAKVFICLEGRGSAGQAVDT